MNVAPAFSDAALETTLLLLLLSPLALAGMAIMNAGFGRSRSVAQSLIGSLLITATAILFFALLGTSIAGSANEPSITLHCANKPWNLLSTSSLFFNGFIAAPLFSQLGYLFQFFAVALTALIPWGSGADRLRLVSGCAVAAILSALFFPLFAHWTFSNGWLSQLGQNFSLGIGFLDPGGSASIHTLGGLSALALIWITGPRKNKFPKEGLANAIPGHNAAFIFFGCFLSFVGFTSFNLAGNILWLHAPITALPTAVIDTLLTASSAVIATSLTTRIRFGKPDAGLCGNGWLAGLVSSSATAGIVSPLAAVLIGIIAGILTPLLIEFFELAVSIDDPSGAIAVHAAAGLWGIFAAGIFAPQQGQLLAQLIGIAALLGFALPVLYAIFFILNRILPFRVEPEGERIGMDIHELGGSAYPEFVIHHDDSGR